jgi:hypothetical protein
VVLLLSQYLLSSLLFYNDLNKVNTYLSKQKPLLLLISDNKATRKLYKINELKYNRLDIRLLVSLRSNSNNENTFDSHILFTNGNAGTFYEYRLFHD